MRGLFQRPKGETLRLRTKYIAVAAVLAAAGLGILAAPGLGDRDQARVLAPEVLRPEVKSVQTERLSRAEAVARGLPTASRKKKKIKFVLIVSSLTFGQVFVPASPVPGAVIEMQCPPNSLPVSGGLQNNNVFMLEAGSSRANPTGGPTIENGWYETVRNAVGASTGVTPTLTCAEVKKA